MSTTPWQLASPGSCAGSLGMAREGGISSWDGIGISRSRGEHLGLVLMSGIDERVLMSGVDERCCAFAEVSSTGGSVHRGCIFKFEMGVFLAGAQVAPPGP